MRSGMSISAAALVALSGGAFGQDVKPHRPPGPPVLSLPGAAAQARLPSLRNAFTARPGAGALFAVGFDTGALRAGFGDHGAAVIESFPLSATRRVDLEVERFWVTKPTTRFVLGSNGDADQPLEFDPASVLLLRGRVRGVAHSNVFLGISDYGTNGVIDLGPGQGRFGVSSRSAFGGRLAPGLAAVFPGGSDRSPASFCTVLGEPHEPAAIDAPIKGLRQVEIAIETDNQYFNLMADPQAAAAYIVQVYGASSDILIRDASARLDITYVRLWPTGNVPFTTGLSGLRDYWNANMQAVPRDVVQMFSGRADLPGGVAYLSALCGSSAYSFMGNALGYFADTAASSVLNYDPLVVVHELGHNFGTGHTDAYAIDACNTVTVTPQRGTIMSYCNQTVSGAMSVIDMRFHKGTMDKMAEYFATNPSCIVIDCNQNGISDALDIASQVSADANANGVPDECEDCNHNNILDSVEISSQTSADVNSNGVPDECEPDCNGNNVPDEMDIRLNTSQDAHGDTVPDECEANLNNANGSDYNEIMANMTLDKNRDRILDSVQDCDGDLVTDLVELDGAWDVWTASLLAENTIREFHSITGVLMRVGQAATVTQGQDLIITANQRILVTSANGNRVVEFNKQGQMVGTLVAAGAGGLANPATMVITPMGTLLVASRGTANVLEYDLTTGAFLRVFVAAGNGLTLPFGMTYGPNGNLFVTSSGNQVYEYHGTTGAFVRIFVPSAGNGGLSAPRGMVFNPLTGNLLVCSFNTDQVLEYNGATGAFIRQWLVTGLTIDGPWCVRVGPEGMIYVSRNNPFPTDTHVTRARIFIHDPRNGYFVRAHTQALDSGLDRPTGFDFMPGAATDCNLNAHPDNCDIVGGTSLDMNGNGKPDECEAGFCYGNCDESTASPILNVADFTCFLTRYAAGCATPHSCYPNCDGSTAAPFLNVADFTCFLTKFAGGCP